MVIFFFKQKTSYEMRISDWSSDVCSSDLAAKHPAEASPRARPERQCWPRPREPQRQQTMQARVVREGRSTEYRRAPVSPVGEPMPTRRSLSRLSTKAMCQIEKKAIDICGATIPPRKKRRRSEQRQSAENIIRRTADQTPIGREHD